MFQGSRPRILFSAVIGALFALTAAFPSFAAEKGEAAAEEFVPGQEEAISIQPASATPANEYVQLNAFTALILVDGNKRPRLTPMTLILQVENGQFKTVCHMTPRIRDAVVGELFQQPILFDRSRGLEVEIVEQRLMESVNRALGGAAGATVLRVFLIPGVPNPARKPIERLPETEIRGCKRG